MVQIADSPKIKTILAKEEFAGKAPFVTGGGTGSGRAAALAFARQGTRVAVSGHPEENIRKTARLIEEQGGRALVIVRDVLPSE